MYVCIAAAYSYIHAYIYVSYVQAHEPYCNKAQVLFLPIFRTFAATPTKSHFKNMSNLSALFIMYAMQCIYSLTHSHAHSLSQPHVNAILQRYDNAHTNTHTSMHRNGCTISMYVCTFFSWPWQKFPKSLLRLWRWKFINASEIKLNYVSDIYLCVQMLKLSNGVVIV